MIFKTVSVNEHNTILLQGDLEESDWAKHHDTAYAKDMESEIASDSEDFDIRYTGHYWSIRVIICKEFNSFTAIYCHNRKIVSVDLEDIELYVWETINRLTE